MEPRMKCSIDGENLVMTERQGIEIDYCPSCRGVWLDRGELDKIIERAGTGAAPVAAPANAGLFSAPPPRDDRRYAESRPRDRDDDDGHRYRGQDPRHGKRKRSGFLGELFD